MSAVINEFVKSAHRGRSEETPQRKYVKVAVSVRATRGLVCSLKIHGFDACAVEKGFPSPRNVLLSARGEWRAEGGRTNSVPSSAANVFPFTERGVIPAGTQAPRLE